MDKKKAKKLMQSRTEIVNRLSDRLESQVQDAEKQLLQAVITDFVDKLDVTDGKIANTLRNKRLIASLDKVFTEFGNTYGTAIASSIATGVNEIFNFNSNYFSEIAKPTELKPIDASVKTTIEGWIGINAKGGVQENGYLSNIIQDGSVRNQIKDIIVNKVLGQAGFKETKQALKEFIQGNKETAGALQKSYRNFVYDTFSKVDRATSLIYADKLDLNYAIYEGGLIKTSRPFCVERNGKVFTRKEISEFDPPNKNPGYDPFTDLGSWGCRHHLSWIPQALAFALRPELRSMAA